MLITRTPLRISIGGGGTDLPSYYRAHGGFLISAAINQYLYIAISRAFNKRYGLRYSILESVENISEIQHPIFREVLRRLNVPPAIDIASFADIPKETGLGSSGSFTVGLLHALHVYHGRPITPHALAEEACHLEIEVLKRPVGKQDQYIAAFGGLTAFEFNRDDTVRAEPLRIPPHALKELEDRLLMFFTGTYREAPSILGDQVKRSVSGDTQMLENLHAIKALGRKIKSALERGDARAFGEIMGEHWAVKQRRSPEISNSRINALYGIGIRNGAVGGKLIGAGGGGFLLFYAEDPEKLRSAMATERLEEVPFRFDHQGSVVMAQD